MPVPENNQVKTSGSSMFHPACGRTRVPVFHRTPTRPFEASTLIASRTRSCSRLDRVANPLNRENRGHSVLLS
jgi:hypothetical protein